MDSTLAIGLMYLAAFITCCIIILNTNSPVKALAYVVLVLVAPPIGIITYFTIGVNFRKNKMYQKKLVVDNESFPELDESGSEFAFQVNKQWQDLLGPYYPMGHYRDIETTLTKDNEIKLLVNGENKFPQLLEDLRAAKHHIHMEYYIYEENEIGVEVANILKEKAQAGVKVRFVYDDFGSKSLHKKFIEDLRKSGVEAMPFYKIKWILFANGINYRNHRKIVVIDGKIGYVGGINISDRYDNTKENKLYWRDTHVRILGPATLSLQYYFLTDWNFCAKQNIQFSAEYFPLNFDLNSPKDPDGKLIQVIGSGPDSDYPAILYSMVQAITLSTKEVLVTTPYFIPDASFIDAVKIAKISGVDVKILIPGVSDSFLVNAVANTYYTELLNMDIEIYRYNKGFVHAKTIICDNFVSLIGTANLDQRSFDLNFEINSTVFDEGFASELREVFFNDLKDSVKLDKKDWNNRPILKVLFERTARLLSPLM